MANFILFSTLGMYAFQFAGIPYSWGGDNLLTGLDCSGFVQRVLEEFYLDPKGDQTAQKLYEHFAKRDLKKSIEADAILFFGPSQHNVKHVALALDDIWMIEAYNGGRNVRTREDAEREEAMVKVTRIDRRKDLVAAYVLEY